MILFLDFDGVTHPEPSKSEDAFCRLPLIESVLRDFAVVDIVVSSAWRLEWACEDEAIIHLRKHFSVDIAPRVIGVTPDHRYVEPSTAPQGLGEYPREWECTAWLHKNRAPGTPWLALDDRAWWFTPGSPHVMIVDCDDGFMPHNEDEFRRRLRELEDSNKALKTPRKAGALK